MSTHVAVREVAGPPLVRVVSEIKPSVEYPLGKIKISEQILCALRDPLIRLCAAYPDFGLKLLQLTHYPRYITANAGTALALEKMYRWHFGAERGGLLVNLWSWFWMNCRNVQAVVARAQIAKLLHIEYLDEHFCHGRDAHLAVIGVGSGRSILEMISEKFIPMLAFGHLEVELVDVDPRTEALMLKVAVECGLEDFIEQVNGGAGSGKPLRYHLVDARNLGGFNNNGPITHFDGCGVLDYFADAAFVKLMRRLARMAAPSAVGIFSHIRDQGPERPWVKKVAWEARLPEGWHFYWRDVPKMLDLFSLAGWEVKKIVGDPYDVYYIYTIELKV